MNSDIRAGSPLPPAFDRLKYSESRTYPNEVRPSCCTSCMAKINTVAKYIFGAILTVCCFWMNPTIFAVSFLGGIMFHEQVKSTIDKIIIVWKYQTICMTFTGMVAAFFSLPVFLATCSSLWAAHLGRSIYEQAISYLPESSELELNLMRT